MSPPSGSRRKCHWEEGEKGALFRSLLSENLKVKLDNSHDDPGGQGSHCRSAPTLGSAGWRGLGSQRGHLHQGTAKVPLIFKLQPPSGPFELLVVRDAQAKKGAAVQAAGITSRISGRGRAAFPPRGRGKDI